MRSFTFLMLLSFFISCPSTSKNSEPKLFNPEEIIGTSWSHSRVTKQQIYTEQNVKLDVVYDTVWAFEKEHMKSSVVCHFSSPVKKTLIVEVRVPVEYNSLKSTVKVLDTHYEKQEYKEIQESLVRKGERRTRIVHCKAEIEKGVYKIKLFGDEIHLEPVVDTIKMKKFVSPELAKQ